MRDFQYSLNLRIISTVVLSFFIWTFGGVFEVAQAASDIAKDQKSNSIARAKVTPPGLSVPQGETKRPEEKLGKVLEFGRKCPTEMKITKEQARDIALRVVRGRFPASVWAEIGHFYELRYFEPNIVQPNVKWGYEIPCWESKNSRLAWDLIYERPEFYYKLDEFMNPDGSWKKLSAAEEERYKEMKRKYNDIHNRLGHTDITIGIKIDAATGEVIGLWSDR